MQETAGLGPWLFAAGTAAWFGFLAYRAGRSKAGWCCGGAVLGLLCSTFLDGVIRATSLPVSAQAVSRCAMQSWIVPLVVILVTGWVITWSLHGRREVPGNLPKEAKPPSARG